MKKQITLKKINKNVEIIIEIDGVIWRQDFYKKLSGKDITELEDAMDNCGEDDERDTIFNEGV